MRKCKQIIELTSQSMDSKLPWLTLLKVKIHLLMCKTCRRYARQLSFMQKALSVIHKHVQAQQLSTEAKQRIALQLQQEETDAGK